MRKVLSTICPVFVLFLLLLASCKVTDQIPSSQVSVTMVSPFPSIEATITPTPTPENPTATATNVIIKLPITTPSPQEIKTGLAELMKTNGGCNGVCLVGIRPEEMTLQDAVDLMSKWGAIVQVGQYYGLSRIPLLDDDVRLSISVGSWIDELVSIDRVIVSIRGSGPDSYIDGEVWQDQQDEWEAFTLAGFINSYGWPTYVGFDFYTLVEPGSPLVGRTIGYGMEVQFEQVDLHMLRGGVGYYDGETLTICPDIDPHHLLIELKPEEPFSKGRSAFRVSWEALTETTIDDMVANITKDSNQDFCVQTTLETIEELLEDFN